MATFGQWFLAQAGRGDQAGYAAKGWRDAKNKPRASAPQTITNFLLADPDQVPELGKDEIEAAMAAAVAQYHQGAYQAGPAVPAPRLDLAQPPLAAVPDPPVSAGEGPEDGVVDDQTIKWMARQLDGLDERLAGLQELVTEGYRRSDQKLAALNELFVAFVQAMEPMLALAGEVMASAAGDAPQSLSDQLGVSPAQQAARDVALNNGWITQRDEGFDWPHTQDHTYGKQQASQPATVFDAAIERGDEHLPAPSDFPQASGYQPHLGRGLYGAQTAPEPSEAQWRAWHEAGQ